MPVSGDEFVKALGLWATGVTIVTSCRGEEVHGMTVSDFAGVSKDPPLVLVCADKTSDTQSMIAESRVFAVNVLAQGQDALSNQFASEKDEHLRFQGVAYRTAATGAPILEGSVVGLDCRVVADHDAGDHIIYVGELEAIVEPPDDRPAAPLLYFAGAYRSLLDLT